MAPRKQAAIDVITQAMKNEVTASSGRFKMMRGRRQAVYGSRRKPFKTLQSSFD